MLGSDLLKIFGGSGAKVVLADTFVSGSTDAYFIIGTDGFIYLREDAGASFKDQPWLSPQVGMNKYEVMAHVASGGGPGPSPLDTWINCSTGPSWGFTTEYAIKQGSLTVEIRRASDGTVLDTVTITIEASGLA